MTGYCFAMNGYLSARLPHAATVREVSVKMFSYSPIHSQSPPRPFLCCVYEYLQWTLHWKPTTGIYPVSHFGDSIETNETLERKNKFSNDNDIVFFSFRIYFPHIFLLFLFTRLEYFHHYQLTKGYHKERKDGSWITCTCYVFNQVFNSYMY